jgi:hypothetical protein
MENRTEGGKQVIVAGNTLEEWREKEIYGKTKSGIIKACTINARVLSFLQWKQKLIILCGRADLW